MDVSCGFQLKTVDFGGSFEPNFITELDQSFERSRQKEREREAERLNPMSCEPVYISWHEERACEVCFSWLSRD